MISHEDPKKSTSSASTESLNTEQSSKPEQGFSLTVLKRLAIKGSIWIILGFGIAQVLRFGGNVILTRLLTPETFGMMGIVTALLTGLQMFSDVGLRPNIIQNRRGEEPTFIRTAWTIQIIRGIILTLAAAILAWPLAFINDEPNLILVISVAGLTSIIAGFHSACLLVYSRRMALNKLVILDLTAHLSSLITMIVWAWYFPSVWALVWGTFAARIVKLIASHTIFSEMPMRLQWEPKAANELIRFGRWIFISTALSFLTSRLDIFVFGKLAGIKMLGFYLLAKNLSRLVVDALMKLSSMVLLPVYSRLAERDPKILQRRTFMIRAILLVLFLPPLWGLILWGDLIIAFIYDDRYQDAGWMLQILTIGSITSAIFATIEPVLLAVGDSFRHMISLATRFCLQIVGMSVGAYLGGVTGFIIGVACAEMFSYPMTVYLIRPYGVWLPLLDLAAFGSTFVVVVIANSSFFFS